MKKFKNVKTGNILRVKDEKTAAIYAASKQYEEVGAAKTKKADKPAE